VHLRLLMPSGKPCEGLLEDDLGPGEFRVSCKRETLSELKKPGKLLQGRKEVYSMIQFPIVPAHCITAHKTQGLTLPKLILSSSSLLPHTGVGGNKGSRGAPQRFLYVVLSRLRALSGLTLLQPLPLDPGNKLYSLGAELESEVRRLSKLERKTLQDHRPFLHMLGVDASPPPAPSPAVLQPHSQGVPRDRSSAALLAIYGSIRDRQAAQFGRGQRPVCPNFVALQRALGAQTAAAAGSPTPPPSAPASSAPVAEQVAPSPASEAAPAAPPAPPAPALAAAADDGPCPMDLD